MPDKDEEVLEPSLDAFGEGMKETTGGTI